MKRTWLFSFSTLWHRYNLYRFAEMSRLTLGHEQEALWLWTSHIAVGAQVPAEHAEVHLYCWHIWDGPQS